MATIDSGPYLAGDGTIRPRTRRPDDPSSPDTYTPDRVRLVNAAAMLEQVKASRGAVALPALGSRGSGAVLNAVELLERAEAEQVLACLGSSASGSAPGVAGTGSDQEHAEAAGYLADRSAREAAAAFAAAQQRARSATRPEDLAARVLELHTQHGPDLIRTAREIELEGWDPSLISPKFLASLDTRADDIRGMYAASPELENAGMDGQIEALGNLRRQLLGARGIDPGAAAGDSEIHLPPPPAAAGPGAGPLAHAVRAMRRLVDLEPQHERGVLGEIGAATIRGVADTTGALATWLGLAGQAIEHPASTAAALSERVLSSGGNSVVTQAAGAQIGEYRASDEGRGALAAADAVHGNPVVGGLARVGADALEAATEGGQMLARPSPSVESPGWTYPDKLRVGDRFEIGASKAEVLDAGADSVTVSVQHPPEMKIGDFFDPGDRHEFELPADMIIPANRASLMRPPEQSAIGRGVGFGEDGPRSSKAPRDDIPFATRGRAHAVFAERFGPHQTKEAGERIAALYREASERGPSKRKAVFHGQVSEAEAAVIKTKTGLDVAGFEHAAYADDMRHIAVQHGDERRQGQLSITAADIERIPEIVRSADVIRRSRDGTREGLAAIEFQKRVNGHVFVVEEVRTGRRQLAVKTMWKYPAAAPDVAGVSPDPRSTPEAVRDQGMNTSPRSTLPTAEHGPYTRPVLG